MATEKAATREKRQTEDQRLNQGIAKGQIGLGLSLARIFLVSQ